MTFDDRLLVQPIATRTTHTKASRSHKLATCLAAVLTLAISTPNLAAAASPPGIAALAEAAVPVASSMAPTSGPLYGFNSVVITGSGFAAGTTTVRFGGELLTPFVNAAGTSATVVVPAGLLAEPVEVIVGNGDTTAAPLVYTYNAPSLLVPGPAAPGDRDSSTGYGWPSGVGVTVQLRDAADMPVPGATVSFTTTAVGIFPAGEFLPIPVGTPDGSYTAVAADQNANSASVPLRIQLRAPTTPTLLSIDPATSPMFGGAQVVLTGTGFIPNVTRAAVDGFNGFWLDDVFSGPAGSSVWQTASPGHFIAGPVPVQVFNDVNDPTALSSPVQLLYEPPTIQALSPANAGRTTTVSGQNWLGGTVELQLVDSANRPVGAPVQSSGDSGGEFVGAELLIPADSTETFYRVLATDGYNPMSAVVLVGDAQPSAQFLDPQAGPTAGGTTVFVPGSEFQAGLTSVTLDGVPATNVVVASDGTSLTFVTPANAVGPADVVITTPGGSTSPYMTFQYLGALVLDSLSPSTGPTSGGTEVTILGSGFATNFTFVLVGGSQILNPDPVIAADGQSLTFITPAHGAGPATITVINDEGTGSGTLNFGYLPVPVAAGITPATGTAAGGRTVTVTGSGFVPDATEVLLDGNAATHVVVAADGLSLTFATGVHPAGPVGVTVRTRGGTSSVLIYTFEKVAAVAAITATSPVAVGRSTRVAGTGFTPNARVTVILTKPDGTSVRSRRSGFTDATGAFINLRLGIPVWTAAGSYAVVATDTAGNTAKTKITVTCRMHPPTHGEGLIALCTPHLPWCPHSTEPASMNPLGVLWWDWCRD